jgi:hypothetical protein
MTQTGMPRVPRLGGLVLGLLMTLSVLALAVTVFAAQEMPLGPDTHVSTDANAVGQSATDARGVSGVVQGPDGEPLADVFILPESLANPPSALPDIAILTDSHGIYHWNLPPGPYRITFIADGYQSETASLLVPADSAALLNVTLSPS